MNEGVGISTAPGRSARTSRRLRSGAVIALGLLSCGLYLLVFRPITNEIAKSEADLERTRRQITETGFGYPGQPGEYLEEVRSKLARMRQLVDELSRRTSFHFGMEELLTSRFRVLEFEQRRFDIQQALTQLAEERGSSLPPDLFAGLPSYYTTNERQQLLWAHLEFFNHVMVALLSSGQDLRVEKIESLSVRTLGEASAAGGSLLELQLRLKVRGSASSLAVFLNGVLPLGQGSGSLSGEKAYSISRLDLQRVADEDDAQVLLDTQLSGFILSEQTF